MDLCCNLDSKPFHIIFRKVFRYTQECLFEVFGQTVTFVQHRGTNFLNFLHNWLYRRTIFQEPYFSLLFQWRPDVLGRVLGVFFRRSRAKKETCFLHVTSVTSPMRVRFKIFGSRRLRQCRYWSDLFRDALTYYSPVS